MDEDTGHTVQKIRETKHRPSKRGEPNLLTGLMFCADCGAKMFNHRTGGYEKKDKDGNPTGKYTNAQDAYHCSTYSLNKGKFVDSCSMHHVRTDVVRDLILETLKATAGFVKEHEEEFISKEIDYINRVIDHEICDIGRASDMCWIIFESGDSQGHYSLHLQCPWRIRQGSDILLSNLDIYKLSEENKEHLVITGTGIEE